MTEYHSDETYTLSELLKSVPKIAEFVSENIKKTALTVQQILPSLKEVVDAVKQQAPEISLQAVFTDEQKRKLREGALELKYRKDGSMLAQLMNPETKQIVCNIPLEEIKNIRPDIITKTAEIASQIQFAEISQQIDELSEAIEEVRRGQITDRLATAYSCRQKLLQTQNITDNALKRQALLEIAHSAEDSRNLLMLSQAENITYIKECPQSTILKIVRGESTKKTDKRIAELRESLESINTVSLAEAIAYRELREYHAAKKSLEYYSDYIKRTYLENENIIERLDMLDASPKNYWSKLLPQIAESIDALPCETFEELKGEVK